MLQRPLKLKEKYFLSTTVFREKLSSNEDRGIILAFALVSRRIELTENLTQLGQLKNLPSGHIWDQGDLGDPSDLTNILHL